MEEKPVFTVDWECWFNAVLPREEWAGQQLRILEPTMFLLDMLQKYEVRAVFYVLGWLRDMMPELCGEIADRGHSIGSHGYWHGHNEFGGPGFRSPYWDTTPMPFPPSGGFFFRVMPLSYLKLAIGASKVFWLHPHDIDEGHPKLSNVALNWKRHVGLKDSREKLERILEEVAFE